MNIERGKGHGYKNDKGLICMIRCFGCGQENYAMAVASGLCAFCEYNPNIKIKNPRSKTQGLKD